MSGWADDEATFLINWLAVSAQPATNVEFHAQIVTAIRGAEKRGAIRELHHAAVRALRYDECELYDELMARAATLEAE